MVNTWNKPKLKLKKTRSEWLWDIVGYSVFIGAIIFLIYHWNALPAEVPAHYNAAGEVDRWGSKFELLLLPIIGVFLTLLMQWLERVPHIHNYPERLNHENAEAFYFISKKLVNQLKNICLILFSVILIESVSIALEKGNGLGIWFLPLAIGVPLIPIIIALIKQSKIK
ncbi:DUF1648 domain-containing protein [Gracilibacillus marinus]|jgi:uncharacterized membrane protein|uniref:DUF1648 domain-containing protein n=1 Tax=Gracilibacillus marinus TaxID=630535 RepID=A0ABV8VXJ8_9BACI